MRLISFFLSFIVIGLTICPLLSLAQTVPNGSTPSETVRAAGKIAVTPIDLESSSFAVFGTPAFKDEEIKSGHYDSGTLSINYTTSEKENPGIPTSLNNWSIRTESITANVDDNITNAMTDYGPAAAAHATTFVPPPVFEMTPA